MQEPIDKSSKEPVFLLEMPNSLSHIIMKRGHMLRSGRPTRTLHCLGRCGKKSWLEARLIVPHGQSIEESWDRAHDLAARIKRELHSDVYVEPEREHSRFKEVTSIFRASEEVDNNGFIFPGPADDYETGMGMGPGLPTRQADAFANTFVPHHSGPNNPFAMGVGMGTASFPGMPHIPDPMRDLLPQQVRQAMGMGATAGGASARGKTLELKFPALRELPGWPDLSEAKQKMLEAEAAQLHNSGKHPQDRRENLGTSTIGNPPIAATFGDESVLAELSVHPNISSALKHFLLENRKTTTAQQMRFVSN
jgi:hypothetical protein